MPRRGKIDNLSVRQRSCPESRFGILLPSERAHEPHGPSLNKRLPMKYPSLVGLALFSVCTMIALAGGLTRIQPANDRIFPSPADAIKSPPEKLAYVVATYAGTNVKKPDYLATIDVDPNSKSYSQVIHRLRMPNVGD